MSIGARIGSRAALSPPWDPLVDLLDRMVTTGLLKPANRGLIRTAQSPDQALDLLSSAEQATAVPAEKWIKPEER